MPHFTVRAKKPSLTLNMGTNGFFHQSWSGSRSACKHMFSHRLQIQAAARTAYYLRLKPLRFIPRAVNHCGLRLRSSRLRRQCGKLSLERMTADCERVRGGEGEGERERETL
ncbi:hypothetical protein J6590_088042 [Homalodisca vitripennis]|nr:hypothetical protein J6590_088042 [Homalodisca vitripennis]